MVPVPVGIPFHNSEGTGICAVQNLWYSSHKQALDPDETIVGQEKCTKGSPKIREEAFLTAWQRYVDTVVLIGEFMANPPEAQRSIDAISRMNYIHSYVPSISSQNPANRFQHLSE